MSDIIYLDNAATTPILPEVLESMLPYLNTHFGNPSNIYSLGREVRWALEQAREKIASHLNVSSRNIYFTSGATEGANTVIRGLSQNKQITRIITTKIEHHATLNTCSFAQKYLGQKLEYLAVDNQGYPDYNQLEKLLQESKEPTLVALLHINNEIGTILDLVKISTLCQKYAALLYVDTVQSIGHYPLDLKPLNLDFCVASAHKFHGPKGVGLLYVKNPQQMLPLIYGGSQERQMRGGTENVSGIIGMARALELAYQDLAQDTEYIKSLKQSLLDGLARDFSGLFIVNGDALHGAYSILNIGFKKNKQTEMLAFHLDINNICVSYGSACSSGAEKTSHIISGIGNDDYSAIRFSFSKLNTLAEINQLLSILRSLIIN